jgi:hypothetical protein
MAPPNANGAACVRSHSPSRTPKTSSRPSTPRWPSRRKLYRDGESEYLINEIPCRLKDIHDLFLDTGIGPDSYAIIELKMVDDILNDKENSRRLLFEEAAGVSKYKIRKKQTLKKLEDTQHDLERVDDILFEIGKNLKSLENQAKKTRRYFEIKEKYKLASARHAFFTIRGLREPMPASSPRNRASATCSPNRNPSSHATRPASPNSGRNRSRMRAASPIPRRT